MRLDLRNFMRKFIIAPKQDKLKAGDLLLTAEVHRVLQPCFHGNEGEVLVSSVLPECYECKSRGRQECTHMRVMHLNEGGGQQALMKLKPVVEQHHVDLDVEDFFESSSSSVTAKMQSVIMQEIEEFVQAECEKDGYTYYPSESDIKARIVVDLLPKE
jgi:hypothetical protein